MTRWQRISMVILGCLILTGCASTNRPAFQTVAGREFGYRIEDSPNKWIFKVQMVLPAKVDKEFGLLYGYRAVGEECQRRGYRFFDVGVATTRDLDGYCYSRKDHEGLGLEFTALGLEVQPQKFVVASLNGKTKTLLKEKDELTEINGQVVTSMALLKSETAKAILSGAKLINLKVNREDKSLELKEPIAVFKNSSMGPEVLDLARSKAP